MFLFEVNSYGSEKHIHRVKTKDQSHLLLEMGHRIMLLCCHWSTSNSGRLQGHHSNNCHISVTTSAAKYSLGSKQSKWPNLKAESYTISERLFLVPL